MRWARHNKATCVMLVRQTARCCPSSFHSQPFTNATNCKPMPCAVSRDFLAVDTSTWLQRWNTDLLTPSFRVKPKKQRRSWPKCSGGKARQNFVVSVMRADGHHVFVEATFHTTVDEDEVRAVLEAWSEERP